MAADIKAASVAQAKSPLIEVSSLFIGRLARLVYGDKLDISK
jgi:hypothetical protein